MKLHIIVWSGFVHLAHGLGERGLLSAVYDLTMAYPDTKPDTEVRHGPNSLLKM